MDFISQGVSSLKYLSRKGYRFLCAKLADILWHTCNKEKSTVRYALLQNYKMTKEAVNLKQLNKAYRKIVEPRVFKSTAEEVKKSQDLYKRLVEAGAPEGILMNFRQGRLGGAIDRKTVSHFTTPGVLTEQYTPLVAPYLSPKELELVMRDTERQAARMREFSRRGKKRKISAIINLPPDQTRAIREEVGIHSPLITDRGREMVHNTIGLHEAREIRALHRSSSRKLRDPLAGKPATFESHIGPDPMLNDVIIANTLTGEGAKGARDLIMKMRTPELKRLRQQLSGDPRAEALIDKLLAGGRINRHGRKYLDRVHAERLGVVNPRKQAIPPAPQYKPTRKTERAKAVADTLLDQRQSASKPSRGLFKRLKDRFM